VEGFHHSRASPTSFVRTHVQQGLTVADDWPDSPESRLLVGAQRRPRADHGRSSTAGVADTTLNTRKHIITRPDSFGLVRMCLPRSRWWQPPRRYVERVVACEHPKGEGADGLISNAYLEDEIDGRNSRGAGGFDLGSRVRAALNDELTRTHRSVDVGSGRRSTLLITYNTSSTRSDRARSDETVGPAVVLELLYAT